MKNTIRKKFATMSKITVDKVRIMLERDAEHNKFFPLFYSIYILHATVK